MDRQNISGIYDNVIRLMAMYGFPEEIQKSEENMQFLKKCMILSILITEEKLQNPRLESYI